MTMPKNLDRKAALMGGTLILGALGLLLQFFNSNLDDKKMELAIEEEVEKQINARLGESSEIEEEG